MQLNSFDFNTINRPQFLYSVAARLVRLIDDPTDGRGFESFLSDGQRDFPQLFATFHAKKTALVKRSVDERLELKLKLLANVRVMNAKLQGQIDAEKKLDDTILPSDPDECKKRMEEMEDELLEKIEEYKQTITRIHFGAYSVDKLILGKNDLKAFDESAFTSVEAMKPTKRPRHG